ncbi:MAG: GTP cyclohydrolase I, partial [Phycisphaerales bacterium]
MNDFIEQETLPALGDGSITQIDLTDERAQQAMAHVRGLLQFIGEDPDREGLLRTPQRVIASLTEHFRGYHEDPRKLLSRTFSEVEGYNELVLISDIELYSHCE